MMLGTLVLSLMLLSRVTANWPDGSKDATRANMGFYTLNMTCNDAGTECEACYRARAEGLVYLHTVEYTEGPAKFEFRGSAASRDWKQFVVQDDPSEPFRYCMQQDEIQDLDYGGDTWRFSICMDNNFSGISVPAECVKPLAVVSMVSLRTDNEAHGEQTLYCAA
ncbi:uncharacterized protein LOC119730496 [Patiria miniata]|uniref:Uncharacterized protein n=1 Tax=Patiria miniata TaxID=46514 RepID=A0A914A687_PATMI|nr:uncharacterized protein LOC119730496 [Patiria miniata]